MTQAVMIGLALLVIAVLTALVSLKVIKPQGDDRLGMIMIILFMVIAASVFFRVGELSGERKERAQICLDDGYALNLVGHEIYSGNVDLHVFSVIKIDDYNRIVYIDYNEYSPEWSRFDE